MKITLYFRNISLFQFECATIYDIIHRKNVIHLLMSYIDLGFSLNDSNCNINNKY